MESETEQVLKLSRTINDPHLLDHALATLSILASSLEAHVADASRDSKAKTEIKSFTVVDKFAPAEKNEPQPRFKKTTDSAGRKQKMVSLKYVTELYCILINSLGLNLALPHLIVNIYNELMCSNILIGHLTLRRKSAY